MYDGKDVDTMHSMAFAIEIDMGIMDIEGRQKMHLIPRI